MEGRLLARARERQEQLRLRNRAAAEERRAEVYAALPRAMELDRAIRAGMMELTRVVLGESGRTAEEIRDENLALQAERVALLKENGYPEDYLEPIYSCPVCRDTGWADGGICSCLMRLYRQEQTKELAPLLQDESQTFENFRLDLYSDLPGPGSQRSPREQMARNLSICRAYADNFGPDSPNLLFSGAPGLGKTFLSACIARVVAGKDFGVAYDTVVRLLSSFETEKFARGEEGEEASSRVRQLMSCDLLILDDLGTEMSTAFSQSALYTLLDGRIRAGKKTIVSTNLGVTEIEEKYGPALASRLNGEYEWLDFRGRDIRAVRKERG
jgi:DNA replication protein DnaC